MIQAVTKVDSLFGGHRQRHFSIQKGAQRINLSNEQNPGWLGYVGDHTRCLATSVCMYIYIYVLMKPWLRVYKGGHSKFRFGRSNICKYAAHLQIYVYIYMYIKIRMQL